MSSEVVSIAIDGPSGAGKSSVARRAAHVLGYVYIDTGALYRSIGYAARCAGISTKDAAAVEALLPQLSLSLRYIEGEQHVFLGEEDVSQAIRTPEASLAASEVSALPAVRDYLLERQRALAEVSNSILDGRDIGTVVLPQAQVKIFLTASAEERAERRCKELCAKGFREPYEKVLREIRQRDAQDSNRPIAPLKPAADSFTLSTTGLALEDAVNAAVTLIQSKLGDV
ncbi:MAG: (d)CMP kinase [Oscillospiraceae bacterium]|jgi:cytidylate kinase|nr:(d)CMP kinase [Oscillospiraceae bacterium]